MHSDDLMSDGHSTSASYVFRSVMKNFMLMMGCVMMAMVLMSLFSGFPNVYNSIKERQIYDANYLRSEVCRTTGSGHEQSYGNYALQCGQARQRMQSSTFVLAVFETAGNICPRNSFCGEIVLGIMTHLYIAIGLVIVGVFLLSYMNVLKYERSCHDHRVACGSLPVHQPHAPHIVVHGSGGGAGAHKSKTN